MQKLLALTVSVGIVCLLSGCVLVPIAFVGGGIVGGMAISEDTVQTEFDQSYDQVWDASVQILDKAGTIIEKDKEAGRIRAHVTKSKVTVKVDELTPTTVRIQVKSRKIAGVLPDIKTSHTIAYRIGKELKGATVAETAKAGA